MKPPKPLNIKQINSDMESPSKDEFHDISVIEYDVFTKLEKEKED